VGLVEVARNPLELVRVKGGIKREKQPTVLTPEEFRELATHLAEPYRVMATVAVCTSLRISEVLALRWEHIDFAAGTMQVQQGVVNGRVGKTKTEASRDEIPLDGGFRPGADGLEGQESPRYCGVGISKPRYWRMLPCRCDYAQAHQASRGEGWSQGCRLAFVPTFLPWNAGRHRSQYGHTARANAARQHQYDHEYLWKGKYEGKAGSEQQSGADDPAQKGYLCLVWGCVATMPQGFALSY
jgi:integrase